MSKTETVTSKWFLQLEEDKRGAHLKVSDAGNISTSTPSIHPFSYLQCYEKVKAPPPVCHWPVLEWHALFWLNSGSKTLFLLIQERGSHVSKGEELSAGLGFLRQPSEGGHDKYIYFSGFDCVTFQWSTRSVSVLDDTTVKNIQADDKRWSQIQLLPHLNRVVTRPYACLCVRLL